MLADPRPSGVYHAKNQKGRAPFDLNSPAYQLVAARSYRLSPASCHGIVGSDGTRRMTRGRSTVMGLGGFGGFTGFGSGGLPKVRCGSAHAPVPPTSRLRVSIASPHVRPSPNDRRIGIRIRPFEACSGFTLLRPIGSLSGPRPPSSQGSDPASYPAEPPASFRTNRQLSG